MPLDGELVLGAVGAIMGHTKGSNHFIRGHILRLVRWLFVCVFVCLFVCLFVYLFICLFVYLFTNRYAGTGGGYVLTGRESVPWVLDSEPSISCEMLPQKR